MTVTILCPNLKCRMVLAVPESVRGKKVRCKYCGRICLVPTKPSKVTRKRPEQVKAVT